MRKEYTLRQVYFGKLIIFLIIGILQSLIVSVGNLLLLGVYTKHPVFFVVFSMLISIVLMTIVYTLVSIFGNIGKGLAIILLVLQLSSSGGTFPIDVTPPFFQAIHPFLPFTYAINLLRRSRCWSYSCSCGEIYKHITHFYGSCTSCWGTFKTITC